MLKRSSYFIFALCMFAFFVFFSYLVHRNLFTQFDFNMTVRLQDHIPRRFDSFFSFLSFLGQFSITSIFLALILLWQKKLVKAIIVFGMYGFMHLFEIYGKLFVTHKPPPHFMVRTINAISMPQFYVSTDNSYPSGHAARAAFVSMILFFFLKKSKKFDKEAKLLCYAAIIAYDFLMMTSRVYLGEHWTSDVIGGAILGISLGMIGWLVY